MFIFYRGFLWKEQDNRTSRTAFHNFLYDYSATPIHSPIYNGRDTLTSLPFVDLCSNVGHILEKGDPLHIL